MATFTIEEKKSARLEEWKDWITYFIEKKGKSNLISIEYAPELLNDYYWRIAKNYLKPLLKSTDNVEHNIHYYKIISLSELSVMAVLPLVYTDDNDSKKRRLINAELAFFIAISIMLAWKIGDRHVVDNAAVKHVYSFSEEIDVDNKLYPQDFRLEHIEWLKGLNPATPLPILSNSQTWRMMLIAAMFYKQNA